jgi:hypothetical protein
VVERSSYIANPSSPAPLNLNHATALSNKGRNFMGADGLPNTNDDWLVPQKIDITSYQIIE